MTSRRPSRSSRRAAAPTRARANPMESTLRGLLMAGAAWYVAAYLVVAILRMRYPFELEWLEGVVLEHVRRLLSGQSIYVPPSLAFVPLNYTPLYFVLSAALARILGLSLSTLRLVSFLGSLGSFALLFALVFRETRSRAAGWVAIGLFAGAYRLGGAWLDVARADSLYLAFVLAGVVILRADPSVVRAPLLAALAFSLGFATKQSAVVVVAPLILWLVIREPRRGWTLAVALAAMVAGTVLWLDRGSGGWFHYYAFDVARRHPMSFSRLGAFPLHDLRPFVPSIAVVVWGSWRRETRPSSEVLGFHGAFVAGLVASAWQLRLYEGGYDNVLMTAHLAIALATALAWSALCRPSPSRGAPVVATALLLAQCALLWWNPMRQVPTEADRAAYQQLVEGMSTLPGRVFVSSHSDLAERAGKPAHVQVMCFMDVVKGSQGRIESDLLRAMRDTLAAHVYPTLVMDNRDWLLPEALRAGYVVRGEVLRDPTVGWPVTGMRTRPKYLLFPASPDSTRTAP
jgi:hypothetical protein